MKYILLSSLLLMVVWGTRGQDATKNKSDIKIKFKGFVNLQAFYDTRQMVEAREGIFTLYPKKPEYDQNQVDKNAEPGFQMLSMTSRISANITGPDALGAKLHSVIEGDFTGVHNNDNNGFRLRHAYIRLDWEKQHLIFGHTWHPFYVPDVSVGSIALNTGAPFHAFSRFNQVQFIQDVKNFHVLLFAGMQRDYASAGELGTSNIYQRNAGLPNFHGQLKYKNKGWNAGFGYDAKWIRPCIVSPKNYLNENKLFSTAMVAWIQYESEKLSYKIQATQGGNLTDHLMLGGYGEYISDTLTGISECYSIDQRSVWAVIQQKSGKWRPGIFMGFAQNLGSKHEINGNIYARGSDIKYTYRVAPRLTYHSNHLMLALELEYCVAAYGTALDDHAQVLFASEVANFRTLFGAFYFF